MEFSPATAWIDAPAGESRRTSLARLRACGPSALDDGEARQVRAGLSAEAASDPLGAFGSLPEALAAGRRRSRGGSPRPRPPGQA